MVGGEGSTHIIVIYRSRVSQHLRRAKQFISIAALQPTTRERGTVWSHPRRGNFWRVNSVIKPLKIAFVWVLGRLDTKRSPVNKAPFTGRTQKAERTEHVVSNGNTGHQKHEQNTHVQTSFDIFCEPDLRQFFLHIRRTNFR